jgi:hypothetical protein
MSRRSDEEDLHQAIHTIADWSSPEHVSDAGMPFAWNGPGSLSPEMRSHILGELTWDASPGRYYLGVRLMVAMYLTRFPDEQSHFSGLESWILQDAREKAHNLLTPFAGTSDHGLPSEADNAADRLAVCWAGNPAACDR